LSLLQGLSQVWIDKFFKGRAYASLGNRHGNYHPGTGKNGRRAGQTWHNPSLLGTTWPLEIVGEGSR
jgi:hypothetical protein